MFHSSCAARGNGCWEGEEDCVREERGVYKARGGSFMRGRVADTPAARERLQTHLLDAGLAHFSPRVDGAQVKMGESERNQNNISSFRTTAPRRRQLYLLAGVLIAYLFRESAPGAWAPS